MSRFGLALALSAALTAPPLVAQSEGPTNLFLQGAQSGTLVQDSLPGFHRLTLQGVDPRIVYFTDNVATVTETLDFDLFHRAVVPKGDLPATGALVFADGPVKGRSLLLEFHQTQYDAANRKVSFLVKLLDATYDDPDLAPFVGQLTTPPASFGGVSLHWSICHSGPIICYGGFQGGPGQTCRVSCGGVGSGSYAWDWAVFKCVPKPDQADNCTRTVCNNTSDFCRRNQCIDYPECFGQ